MSRANRKKIEDDQWIATSGAGSRGKLVHVNARGSAEEKQGDEGDLAPVSEECLKGGGNVSLRFVLFWLQGTESCTFE
jgi:hypothetical protein